LKSSNAASLVMLPAGAFEPEIIPPMDEVLRKSLAETLGLEFFLDAGATNLD
jgi:hypothetical protein